MTYDHWKTTNPADEHLGPDEEDQCEVCGGRNGHHAFYHSHGLRQCEICERMVPLFAVCTALEPARGCGLYIGREEET